MHHDNSASSCFLPSISEIKLEGPAYSSLALFFMEIGDDASQLPEHGTKKRLYITKVATSAGINVAD